MNDRLEWKWSRDTRGSVLLAHTLFSVHYSQQLGTLERVILPQGLEMKLSMVIRVSLHAKSLPSTEGTLACYQTLWDLSYLTLKSSAQAGLGLANHKATVHG